MIEHSYQHVQQVSWFKNIIGSFYSFIFGLILLIVTIIAIIWNEDSFHDRFETLRAAKKEVISIDPKIYDPKLDYKLIHLTGIAKTNEILIDNQFNLSINAIKLKRIVEMYQWEEQRQSNETSGSAGSKTITTDYTYSKTWSKDHINSSQFHKRNEYINPQSFPIKNELMQARNVAIDKINLTGVFIEQINAYQPIKIDEQFINNLPSIVKKNFKKHNNYLYSGKNMDEPEIGDIRIRFSYVGDNTISVIGAQNRNFLSAYQFPSGSISLLEIGNLTHQEMIKIAEESNVFWAWAIRIGSIFFLFISFRMLFSPIHALAYIIPYLRDFVEMGINFVCFILALFIGPSIMSLAWSMNRPAISIAIIVLLFIIIRTIVRYVNNRKNKKANSLYPYQY